MGMKEQGRKVYKSMNGKVIELDKLIMRNETAVAVGNAKVNARGDELGPGGAIIRKREDIMTEYHSHADAVPDLTISRKSTNQASTPKNAPEPQIQPTVKNALTDIKKPKAEEKLEQEEK